MIKRFEQYVNENLTSLVGRYKNNGGIRKEDEITEDYVRSFNNTSNYDYIDNKTYEFHKGEIKSISIKYINGKPVVDVDGDFVFDESRKMKKLPFNFGKVTGNFICRSIDLETLEGCPEEVGKNFECSDNKLTSLEYAPKKVGWSFVCSKNIYISSLEGCPQEVEGIECENCGLISLKGCPEEVLFLDCEGNKLTSFRGAPKRIRETFDCSYNNILSSKYFPEEVGGDFICTGNSELMSKLDEIRGHVKGHIK